MILNLFAGPGGWCEGARQAGLDGIGIEWDKAACLTRRAAGHLTIRADVATYPLEPFIGKVAGLIASPPCPDFSSAGKRAGVEGKSGHLIFQVPRWVTGLMPTWVACEQVPEVLPWWKQFAHDFRELGYSTWAGILCAADFGVPQERYRAFLLCHLNKPVQPPAPTHAENPALTLDGTELRPWVSMAEGLGWGEDKQWVQRERSGDRSEEGFVPEQPSQTLTSKARSWKVQGNGGGLTLSASEGRGDRE